MEIDVDVSAGTVSLDNISGPYSAQELRQLIRDLTQAQAQIANDPHGPQGQSVVLVPDGHWYCELFNGGTDTVFTLLVPGFGWTGLTFAAVDRMKLGALLVNQQLATMSASPAAAGSTQPNTSGGNKLH